MLPVVAIEIPPELPPTLAATTVRACETTLGAGRCRLRTEPEVRNSPWIAKIVAAKEGQDSYRVELQRTEAEPVQLHLSRTLAFAPNESESERWSTMGVVVAALVVSASSAPSSETLNATGSAAAAASLDSAVPNRSTDGTSAAQRASRLAVVAPPQTKNPSLGASRNHHGMHAGLGLHALYSGTIQPSTKRVGLLVVPSLALSDTTAVWLGASMSYANQSVSTRAWAAAAGIAVGTVRQRLRFGLEGRIGMQCEFVTFQIHEGSETDRDSRWRFGLNSGLDLRFTPTRSLDLLVSLTGVALVPDVRVTVRGRAVDELGPLQGTAGVGLRAWLDP